MRKFYIDFRKTERKHWENGFSVRGGHYWIIAFSLYFFGVLIAKDGISFYKLQ